MIVLWSDVKMSENMHFHALPPHEMKLFSWFISCIYERRELQKVAKEQQGRLCSTVVCVVCNLSCWSPLYANIFALEGISKAEMAVI